MRRFKYVGPHDAIDLEGVGRVEQGHSVDIEDAATSAGLDGQADWEHVPMANQSRKPKKAEPVSEPVTDTKNAEKGDD